MEPTKTSIIPKNGIKIADLKLCRSTINKALGIVHLNKHLFLKNIVNVKRVLHPKRKKNSHVYL